MRYGRSWPIADAGRSPANPVQRALDSLAEAAKVQSFGRRWLFPRPIVAECVDRRLDCPPNMRAVCSMLEMADA